MGTDGLKCAAAAALLGLAGCFTLSETPYPSTVMSRPGTAGKAVSVRGFEALVTRFATVNGLQTVYVDGWYGGPWYGGPGYWETVPVVATVAQPVPTDFFRERAQSRFEDAGWIVMAQSPDYLVDVKFSGPTEPANAGWWRTLRIVGTLFFGDRAVRTWHAKLRVYDNRTGALAFTRDYSETDDESMLSVVPVFGPICYEKTDFDCMRMRCLAALTDRASADASACLSGSVR